MPNQSKQVHDERAAVNRRINHQKIWFIKSLELAADLDFSKINKVIDLGAGKGEFLELLKSQYPHLEVWAADYAETNLVVLKSKGVKTLSVDFDNFSLNDYSHLFSSFDLVVALETIEHIFDADKFLKFANLLLKNNRYLLISTPNTGCLQNKLFYLLRGFPMSDGHHVRFFTKKRLIQHLFFNGFETVKSNNFYMKYTDILRRGFGVRNQRVVFFLRKILFTPLHFLSYFKLADSAANTNLVYLTQKNNLYPLSLQWEILNKVFSSLPKEDQLAWLSKIKNFLKNDYMNENLHLQGFILNLLSEYYEK